MQIEIEINDSIDRVFIYKIEQTSLNEKDSRIVCNSLCNDIFVNWK